MSGLKFFHILLFFPICFILSQEAFQTRSITSLTQETTELRDVFLNKTCISIISLPSTDFQTNTSNIKIFNIQITPKSYDLSSQKVELDGYEASIIFTGGNAELDVSFQYIMNTTNESTTGGGSGEISLRNLSNHKHISVVNYKPEFFTSNLGIESLNLTLNSKNPIEVNTNFQNLYGSNFGLIITVLQANISSCLNNWFYPEESFNFFKTYLYNYKENIITYKYLLTNLLFGTNHIGFWYNAQIDNYTKGRTINLNPTNIIKQIPTNSNANTFYGRSILYHSIANALEKKLFDLNLNEIEYPSSHFDYFIGEIALFMPSIRKAFYADERISGFCKILNPANATYDVNFIRNYH